VTLTGRPDTPRIARMRDFGYGGSHQRLARYYLRTPLAPSEKGGLKTA
jgi:hypothetical protein